MRILMYAKSLKREGGTEISGVQIARALSERGHRVDLLYECDGELRPEYLSFCRSVTRAWMSVNKQTVRDAIRLIPAIWSGARRRPDVIYVHRFRDVICARLTGMVVGAPVVCHLRDTFHDGTTPRLANWADRFIAVSGATRDSWVRDGLDRTRVDVVHTGINPMDYPAGGQVERLEARDALGIPAHVFVAVYYGRLDVDKGVDLLLDAWRELDMSADEGRLVLQGRPVLASDPGRYLRELQDRAPAGCHWLPMRDDVMTVLHAADTVVLPSHTEGLSRTVLEGMVSARPVVASRVGGVPEILSGSFERFLFDSGDTAGLVSRLESVVDWQRHEPQLGAACSEHVRSHFSMQTMAAKVEDILQHEVRNRSRSDCSRDHACLWPRGKRAQFLVSVQFRKTPRSKQRIVWPFEGRVVVTDEKDGVVHGGEQARRVLGIPRLSHGLRPEEYQARVMGIPREWFGKFRERSGRPLVDLRPITHPLRWWRWRRQVRRLGPFAPDYGDDTRPTSSLGDE